MKRAVFLDRDGVLNEPVMRDGRPFPPDDAAATSISPGCDRALRELRALGFELLVVTNQPDIARKTRMRDDVDGIHAFLAAALPLDGFYVCDHDDEDRCSCRKPLPGLIVRAAQERGIDLAASYMIGDRWRDIEAGRAAGVTTIFLDRGHAERRPDPPADVVARTILEASKWISERSSGETPAVSKLRTKVFADGADIPSIARLAAEPYIAGFTTNPTLMRKAGIGDYVAFAREALSLVGNRSISFEVFADDEREMERQARIIAAWADNVFVKIPVTDTKGQSTAALVRRLSADGVQLNVTAVFTVEQVSEVVSALSGGAPAYVSVFAGRIADTGRDPLPIMRASLERMRSEEQVELVWASPREVLNVFQADEIGCHIITVTGDILAKLAGAGKDLTMFSLETVRMFHADAAAAAYAL
jgi:transaldolase